MAEKFAPNPRAIPTHDQGLRNVLTLESTRVIADVADELALYQPSSNPFMALVGKLRAKRSTTQYKFDWHEVDEFPRSFSIVTDAGTTVTVGSGEGTRLRSGDVLLNSVTREHILVTATPSTDAVTVVRGIGGFTSTMATDGSQTLVLLGSAYPDASQLGALVSIREENKYNYTQIIRTPFGVSGRQAVTKLYGGNDLNNQRKQWGIEHAKQIEQFMFFGTRFTRTHSSGYQQTGMGGLEYFIKSNIWDLNQKKPTERSFVEFLEHAMKWGAGGNQNGSATKYLLHSARWGTEIEFWAKDKIQYKTLEKVGGLALGEYVTTHGRVMLVHAPILDYQHQDTAFLLDLNHLKYAYLNERDTKLMNDRQENDADFVEEEYFSDVSLEVKLEGAHAILRGLPL